MTAAERGSPPTAKGPQMTRKPTRAPAGGTPLRLIALGGMGEIGKNCYLYEYGDDILLVDAGLAFPDEATPGVDIIIPDLSYLAGRIKNVRGILVTHAHEDHIGALPHLLPELPGVPVYASTLARGLIGAKLKGAKAGHHTLHPLDPGDTVRLGAFTVEPFRIGHSIPDAQGFALHTPVGTVIHTGDFKFDRTPIDGRGTDFELLKRFGAEGVLALVSDSRIGPDLIDGLRLRAEATLRTDPADAAGAVALFLFDSLEKAGKADKDAVAEALRTVAQRTTAANIRNWCITRARDLDGTASLDRLRTHRLGRQVANWPLERAIAMLRVMVEPDLLEGIDVHVAFDLDGERCGLHFRNHVACPTTGSNPDATVSGRRTAMDRVLSGASTFYDEVRAGELTIGGDQHGCRRAMCSIELAGFATGSAS
mgnify:CR=1 FL=1